MVSNALANRSRLLALGGVLAVILIVVAAPFPGHFVFAQETIPVPAPVVTPEPTPEATSESTPEATPESTPEATPEPTPAVTPEPTPAVTPEPTPAVTPEPTPAATPEPTPAATAEPTPAATPEPTPVSTPEPTPEVSPEPTPEARAEATPEPTTEKSTETIEPTPPQTAKQVQGQANRPDAPGNLSAVRASSTTQMKPALDVTWTTPAANGTTITQYDVYYGTDKNNMTKYSGTVGPSATSLRLTDLTAGATYHVRVLAFAGNDGQNGTAGHSADTSAKTNNPPKAGSESLTNAELIRGPLATHSTPAGKWTAYFTDSDGDTLTPSVAPQYAGLLKALASTGTEYSIRLEGLNPGTSKLTYGVSDGYGGFATRVVTYTIVDNPARAIMENSAAGTAVGAPVAGTPYDDGDDSTDDALTHTLHGEAATYFDIDTATGQISVKQGTSLDYETKTSYTGQVKWTVQDQEAVANLTINVTDLEAGEPDAPTLTRTEFSEPSKPALDVTWTAPDTNGTTITGYEAQYREKVADGETPNNWTDYTIDDGNGGQTKTLPASTTSINLPDLTAGATYEAQVRALTSLEGEGPWSDAGEDTANQPPAWNGVFFLDIGTLTWNSIVTIQNSLADHFTDADGDTLTYSASSEYVGIINAWVEGDHPKLRVYNPAASEVTFRASDPYGGVSDTFTHTYVGSANVTRTVRENSPADTMVGDRVQGHPYNGQALTYTLTGELADSGNFYIKPLGRIRLKSGANLDYETKSTYTGKVEYTIQGQPVAINVTVNVIDVEAVIASAPTLTRTEFSEQSDPALDVTWTAATANGLTITGYEAQYREKVADGETENSWTLYTYEDPDNADNQISELSATTTSINLPDLTPGAAYEAQVRALTSEEGEGPWSDIGEGTANTPPSRILTEDTYYETNPGKYGKGKVWSNALDAGSFPDPDGDTLTYEPVSANDAAARGEIRTNNGVQEFRTVLRHPVTSYVAITLKVSDGYGGTNFLKVHVKGTRSETWSVNENSNARTVVGRLFSRTASNPQADANSLSLSDFPAGLWTIGADRTGLVRVATGATLDYETTSSYTGKILYTAGGVNAVVNVTINVTDIEVGKPDAPTFTRTQFSEQSNPALDVEWTAPDANGSTITGYEAQYRVKVADGETPNNWTDYTIDDGDGGQTKTLPVSTTSINLPDLTAGATYEVQVRALTSLEGEGPWSDAGEGRANRPPTTSGTGLSDASIAVGAASDYDISDKFTDADSDTLTYLASPAQPGVLTTAITGSDADTLTVTAVNPAATTVTYGVSDGYGGYVSRTVTYTGTANVSRSVDENSAVGTAAGDPVTGTPYKSETLSYSLTGAAADAFVIDSSTGQISVKTGTTLDYETKDSYTGKVNWTVQGQSATASLTINVNDLEAGKADAPTLARTEFSEKSNPALDVEWTAPDANGTTITGYEAQYRVKVADGETENSWTLYTYEDPDDADNQISELSASTTSINLPDLTAGATYEVQVRALTSLEGEGSWSDAGEGTANTPPNRILTQDTYYETNPGKYGKGKVWSNALDAGSFPDPDGDTLTYEPVSDNDAVARGEIRTNNGVQEFRTVLRHPVTSYVAITLKVSDGYGGTNFLKVHVKGTRSETWSVNENSNARTVVGRLFGRIASNPQADANSLSLSGFPAGLWTIDADRTGLVRVATGATLDYETTSSYTGKMEYTAGGVDAVVNITINVTDLEAGKPDAPTLTRTEFSEQSNPALDVEWTAADAKGTTITGYEAQYRVKVADGETENSWTLYTYEDPDDADTQISKLAATTTSINLPDLTAGATYEVQVRALTSLEGEGPWSDAGEGTANTPPTTSGTGLSDASIAVGAATDYDISDKFTDVDSDTLTYSASPAQPGVLTTAITGDDSDTLTVTAVNPAATTVTYGVSDGYGGYVSRTVTYTGTANVSRSVDENSAVGTAVGGPVTGTPYKSETLSYSLTGAAADAFVIDSATGQISVKQGATLDHEATSSYAGTVSYSVQGQSATVSLTINVNDLEAGKPDAPTLARTQFSKQSNPALDVTWTAPDANGTTITGYEAQYRVKVADGETENSWTLYTYEDPDNAGSQISNLPATPLSLRLPDLDAGVTYEVQVRALTSLEGEGSWSDAGECTANRPPNSTTAQFPGGVPSLIDAGNGNQIGGHFEDADSDTLTYSASSAHPGVFTVALTGDNSDTLALTAVNPASTTIIYGALDPYGGYVARTFTVTAQRSETLSIAENSAAGTAVGDPITGTPYNGETLSYSLSGAAADAFVIDSATGQISVKQGATIDYETTNSYAGTVQYAVQGQTATVSVTINVTDLTVPTQPDAPTLTQSTTDPTTILDVSWSAQHTAGGLPVINYEAQYRLKAVEGDPANAWTLYKYDDPANPGTEISKLAATTTSIELTGLTKNTTYEVQVRAYNVEGASVWSTTGGGATNADNNPPQFSRQGAQRSVAENSPAGTTVGAPVTAIDLDGHELTYALKTPSSQFTVNSATGQITVAEGASLDYESQRKYTVVVQASDGLSVIGIGDGRIVDAEMTVSITVADEDEAPPVPDAPTVTRSPSSPTSALNVTWSAPDMTGKPAITSYVISYKKTSASQWTERSLIGLQTSATLTGLQAGTAYHVSIRAANDEGSSKRSENGLGSTAGSTSPTPPTQPGPTPIPTLPESPSAPTTPEPTSTPTPPEPTFTPTPPEPTSTPTPPEPTSTPTPPGTPSTPTPEPTPVVTPGAKVVPTPQPTVISTPDLELSSNSEPTRDPAEGSERETTRDDTPTQSPDPEIGSTPEPTFSPTPTPTGEARGNSTPTPTPEPTPEPSAGQRPIPTPDPTPEPEPRLTAPTLTYKQDVAASDSLVDQIFAVNGPRGVAFSLGAPNVPNMVPYRNARAPP